MPSIRPYRKGFRAEIALKGHPRVSRCFPTEEAAAAWAAETERAPFHHRRAWTAARREARLLDLRFHDLRHGFASALAQDGASSRELQHATGHVNANMLARYAHFQDERTLELGDRITRLLFPPENTP